MLAVCLTAASLDFTQWAHDHPVGIHKVVVYSLVVSLICGAFWMLTAEPKTNPAIPLPLPPNEDVSGVRAGRDLSVGGHLVQGDLHNHPLVLPTTPEPPHPLLAISNALEVNLMQDAGVRWVRQHDGHEFVVAAVTNRTEHEGHKACHAEAIVVRLQFSDYEGPVRSIQRAYWIDFSENVVDIKIGTTKLFLLGCMTDSHWTTFENERDIPYTFEEGDSFEKRVRDKLRGGIGSFRTVTHVMVSKRIPMTPGLRITATVFSEKTGKDLDERTFYL